MCVNSLLKSLHSQTDLIHNTITTLKLVTEIKITAHQMVIVKQAILFIERRLNMVVVLYYIRWTTQTFICIKTIWLAKSWIQNNKR